MSDPNQVHADVALPERGEFVVRNAYVLTMDPELGDVAGGDVHVKDGVIVAVGKDLPAPGAAVIDGRRSIVLPGFVDTHWHMWTTLLRGLSGDTPDKGYFPVTTACGQVMTPEDMYSGTRLSAAEAIYCGITTVCDHCHNVRSHDHAVEDIRALRESGVRGQWHYGPFRGIPATQGIDMADVEHFHDNWANYSNGGLLALGFAWGGVGSTYAPKPPEAYERARQEFETARRLGLPISVHLGTRENAPPGEVEAYVNGNFLGKDVMLIHVLSASPDEMKMIAASGSPVTVSPGTELRIGYGLTKACDFMEAGVPICVSIDTVPLSGNASMFSALKLMRCAEHAKACDEFKMTARRSLEIATIDGAKILGMDHLIGSLTPGKRADLIMVSTDTVTMGVFTDAARLLVEAAEPSNVDTVVIDGRILKRGGRLTACDPRRIIDDACHSLQGVIERAGWSV